jgi:uncharacterized protein
MQKNTIESPCIGICELGLDNICSGCFRTLEEIGGWGYASEKEQRQIVLNCEQRKQSNQND